MPSKTLLRAGVVTILVGIFLLWSTPIWVRFLEIYPWNYQELAPILFWFDVSLVGAGGLLLLRAVFGLLPLRWESHRGISILPGAILKNVLPWPRLRLPPLITQLPNFGLISGGVLWPSLIFMFMIVDQPRPYYGLPVDFRANDSVVWEKSPWPETLSVYLAVGEKYYINGQLVSRDAVRSKLEQELSHRMVWTVYFEADSDTLNMDALYAMDTIQGLGAKLIWITPKVRKGLQKKEQFAERVSR